VTFDTAAVLLLAMVVMVVILRSTGTLVRGGSEGRKIEIAG
jgi:hypothetical protein